MYAVGTIILDIDGLPLFKGFLISGDLGLEVGVYAIGVFYSQVIRHECVAGSRTSIYLLRVSLFRKAAKEKKRK